MNQFTYAYMCYLPLMNQVWRQQLSDGSIYIYIYCINLLIFLFLQFRQLSMVLWLWHQSIPQINAGIMLIAPLWTGPGEFPTQRPVTRSFMFSLICVWINRWINNREAGDLIRYHAHYDVIVMWRASQRATNSKSVSFSWRHHHMNFSSGMSGSLSWY